jgi:hypothetical protein
MNVEKAEYYSRVRANKLEWIPLTSDWKLELP